jgi:serine/threonine protein kinase
VACFPDFLSRKVGKARICADVALLASVGSDLLANPDRLFGRADCTVIKDQVKIKIGRVVLKIDGIPIGVYVKRYNAFSTRYRMASLIRRSGAVKSLRGADILSRSGVATGKPLAAMESRSWGMLDGSFYLSEEIPQAKTADAYWREKLKPISGVEGLRPRRNFLRALAGLFSRLHRAKIYHSDLKDANIIVSAGSIGEERFFLLDLEGVRRCSFLSRRRRIKNLVQLNRTLGRFLSRSDKLFFLISYLTMNGTEKRAKRQWVNEILYATAMRDQNSLRKASHNQRATSETKDNAKSVH